jgi:sugar-specific transcriptional regulator TrmB
MKLEHVITGDREKVQLLRSIARLKAHSEFQDLVDALRRSLSVIDQKNRAAESPTLQWGQGAAQYVSGLLETIDNADATSRTIESRLRKNQ